MRRSDLSEVSAEVASSEREGDELANLLCVHKAETSSCFARKITSADKDTTSIVRVRARQTPTWQTSLLFNFGSLLSNYSSTSIDLLSSWTVGQ